MKRGRQRAEPVRLRTGGVRRLQQRDRRFGLTFSASRVPLLDEESCKLHAKLGQRVPVLEPGVLLRRQPLAHRERGEVATFGAGQVTEVGDAAATEIVGQPLVRGRQLALQGYVALRFARESIEVLGRSLDHQLPRSERTRQVGDGVVKLEQERVASRRTSVNRCSARSRCFAGDVSLVEGEHPDPR